MKALVIVFLLLMAGCITPLQRQAQFLNAAYRSGEISAGDYYARMNELQAIQAQNQASLGAALINYGAIRSLSPPPYQMQVAPIPQLQQQRSGWITGPRGQTYFYMGN